MPPAMETQSSNHQMVRVFPLKTYLGGRDYGDLIK